VLLASAICWLLTDLVSAHLTILAGTGHPLALRLHLAFQQFLISRQIVKGRFYDSACLFSDEDFNVLCCRS
jgi:hypothetical protein